MAAPLHDSNRPSQVHSTARPPALERLQQALEKAPRLSHLTGPEAARARDYQGRAAGDIQKLRQGLKLPELPARRLLPRSGWESKTALREAVGRSRSLVARSERNWKQRIADLTGRPGATLPWRLKGRVPQLPDIRPMPMYGMPMPPRDDVPLPQPMYGMPIPPKDDFPHPMPMYGMPMPPRDDVPLPQPMYGMPIPPKDDFPHPMPMYGMPIPPRDDVPLPQPMYGMPIPPRDDFPHPMPMYGMPIPPRDDVPLPQPMYGMPLPPKDDFPDVRPMYGMPVPGEELPLPGQ